MRRSEIAIVGLVCLATGMSAARAEEGVRFEERNGQTYKVTTDKYYEPTTVTDWEEKHQTVYTERYTTEVKETHRDIYTPVVEYVWEPRVHGRWNPFAPDHVAYHLVPRTRWEVRRESVEVPVTRRELVPETRVVRVPTRKLVMVEKTREQMVAVNPAPATTVEQSPIRVATRPLPLGGVQSYENGDIPKRSPSDLLPR